MLAIDTNVIVRYLTGDDPKQAADARMCIDGSDVFVSKTVLLETEWVLRGAYSYPRSRVAEALRAFVGLARVTMEDAAQVSEALDWADAGMDFADALHLASAADCAAFMTFDKRFSRALRRSTLRIRAPGTN